MIILALAQSPAMLILSALFEGAGAGILIPLILALISDRSFANERGKVFCSMYGWLRCRNSSGWFLLWAHCPFILGGYRGIFALAAVLALFALIIFYDSS